MWDLDYKESWALKYWCFWTVVLEKTLESPLDCKEIQPVHPKGNQSWVFIGRTDAEAETPILWPPDTKSWLIWKDPDAGKDWSWEEKGTTGWDGWMASPTRWTWVWVSSRSWWGQKRLVCCSPWGHKEWDRTEGLDWTEYLWLESVCCLPVQTGICYLVKNMFAKWKDNDCFLPFLELKKEKYPKTIITENNWRLHSQDPLK